MAAKLLVGNQTHMNCNAHLISSKYKKLLKRNEKDTKETERKQLPAFDAGFCCKPKAASKFLSSSWWRLEGQQPIKLVILYWLLHQCCYCMLLELICRKNERNRGKMRSMGHTHSEGKASKERNSQRQFTCMQKLKRQKIDLEIWQLNCKQHIETDLPQTSSTIEMPHY